MNEENNEITEDNKEAEAEVVEITEAAEEPSELELAQADLAKQKSEYLYLRAEFDNYRRQAIKERSEAQKYGGERVLRELINVLDNFNLALQSELTEDSMKSFEQGVQMIATEFKSSIERAGVTEFTEVGDSFDPNIHEALGTEEDESVEAGKICRVYKKAYKLHDRVIRPAQVVIATAATES